MASISLVLHIASVVCFALGAASVPSGRINLVSLGLFLWFLPSVVAV